MMKVVVTIYPFDQLKIDNKGSFPLDHAQNKFLMVVVNYFSKWVKAKPLTKITKDAAMKFI